MLTVFGQKPSIKIGLNLYVYQSKIAGLMKMVGTKTADYIYPIRATIYKYATTLVHISSYCMVKRSHAG